MFNADREGLKYDEISPYLDQVLENAANNNAANFANWENSAKVIAKENKKDQQDREIAEAAFESYAGNFYTPADDDDTRDRYAIKIDSTPNELGFWIRGTLVEEE